MRVGWMENLNLILEPKELKDWSKVRIKKIYTE